MVCRGDISYTRPSERDPTVSDLYAMSAARTERLLATGLMEDPLGEAPYPAYVVPAKGAQARRVLRRSEDEWRRLGEAAPSQHPVD